MRSGATLTEKERDVHEIAACGILEDLHDELDALVAAAYGWPWPMPREEILERLVALHDERVEEEKRGVVRWLRPEYQVPRFGAKAGAVEPGLGLTPGVVAPVGAATVQWPPTAAQQIGALSALVSERPASVAEAAEHFDGADRRLVERHLETLALMGEVSKNPDTARYSLAKRVA